MKKIFALSFIFLTLISGASAAQKTLKQLAGEWQGFEVTVRDGKIAEEKAKGKLKSLLSELSDCINSNYDMNSGEWVFPVKGYGRNALNKEDFNPNSIYGPYGTKGYSFYDGNRHGGHPAYDIFIKDKNRRALDDKTNKSVKVLAMTDMIILSTNTGWKKGSKLRGGNYIWLINPKEKKLFYYAHLKDISVKPGDFAKKGKALGTVGRTGFSADKKTSPTHVHLMVLEYDQGNLTPFDYLPLLPRGHRS